MHNKVNHRNVFKTLPCKAYTRPLPLAKVLAFHSQGIFPAFNNQIHIMVMRTFI